MRVSMKVLFIVHENKKGGAALSFLDTLKGISKQHDVYVLTPHKKGFIPDKLDELGIKHHSAHYFWWEIASLGNSLIDRIRSAFYRLLNAYNYIEARRIAGFVRRMEIDIIHSNSSTIDIGAIVSELTGIPHIWHLRELGERDFSLKPVGKDLDLHRVINMGRSTYIAISEYVATYFGEYISNPELIRVIYNGIDQSYNYKKSEAEYNKDRIFFLISGNYCEEKGQADVAVAVRILVSRGVKNFKVYMAGRGDFTDVRKFLEDNGIPDYVEFCGLVDDMLRLRKQCDVEIVASKAEAFGRVTVEAMRASNPVIGSATGATTELIQDGVTGFLYGYKDTQALAECMKRFTDDPKLVCRMGQTAYDWAIDKFTSEQNVKSVLEVYEGVI